MRSSSFIPRAGGRAAAAVDGALAGLAEPPRWRFVHEGRSRDEPGLSVETWTEAGDSELQVQLISDDELGLTWISVVHPDPERRELLLERLRDRIPAHTVDELLSDQPPGLPPRSRPVAAALALNGRFDPCLLARIEAALADEDVEIRANAAIAATLLLWPELGGPVAAAARRERDEGVGDMMRAAVAAIETNSNDGNGRGNEG